MDDPYDQLRELLAELSVLRERLEVSLSQLTADHRARSPFAYLMGPEATPDAEQRPLPPER
jgi:hypothetical protein